MITLFGHLLGCPSPLFLAASVAKTREKIRQAAARAHNLFVIFATGQATNNMQSSLDNNFCKPWPIFSAYHFYSLFGQSVVQNLCFANSSAFCIATCRFSAKIFFGKNNYFPQNHALTGRNDFFLLSNCGQFKSNKKTHD